MVIHCRFRNRKHPAGKGGWAMTIGDHILISIINDNTQSSLHNYCQLNNVSILVAIFHEQMLP